MLEKDFLNIEAESINETEYKANLRKAFKLSS
jgi:hypothetical protein